jgi:hypothetical protein
VGTSMEALLVTKRLVFWQRGNHLGDMQQLQMMGICFSVGLSNGYMGAGRYPSVIYLTRAGESED